MKTLKIGLPQNVNPRTIVGVVEESPCVDHLIPTWCIICARRFEYGDNFLALFDGDDELGAVCEECNALNANKIRETVERSLERIEVESERVKRLCAVMDRIRQSTIIPLSILGLADSVRRVQRDMREHSPHAAACCEKPF